MRDGKWVPIGNIDGGVTHDVGETWVSMSGDGTSMAVATTIDVSIYSLTSGTLPLPRRGSRGRSLIPVRS